MLYLGFDTEGKVLKVTNEPCDKIQYMEIDLNLYEKFTNSTIRMSDYLVVKKKDYVLVKKDGKESVNSSILTLEHTPDIQPNSIYVIQNPKTKTFSITHTFEDGKFPPQTYKNFFITDVNNSNKLLCTLHCSYEDFKDTEFTFSAPYFENCKIITRPDMQNYYHFIGEAFE